MKNVLYFEILNYHRDHLERLERSCRLLRLPSPENLTEDILATAYGLFAPLGYRFGAGILDRAPKLRFIATNTTGVPHIDMDLAGRRDIDVYSLAGENEFLATITPTAEMTIGLMIALTRNLLPATRSVSAGRWCRWDFGGDAMLSRMTLGVVGLGRLGTLVAQSARALGMQVAYYERSGHRDHRFLCTECLEELVSVADIVSIHVTMDEVNRHLFSRELFACFKPGAYLVNTARGEVVDPEALVDTLASGRLRGAALDVVDGEFEPGFEGRMEAHPLVRYARDHDNLVLTPHIGGSTHDAWYLTQGYVVDRAVRRLRQQEERAVA